MMYKILFVFLIPFLLNYYVFTDSIEVSDTIRAIRFDKNYFSPPVSFPLRLSGTFGELRPQHFHAGIDIRAEHAEGDSLFATADGYLALLSSQPDKYGNSLQINHDNGLASFFAHIDHFAPRLDSILNIAKENRLENNLDIQLDTNYCIIKRGEFIGFIGNTGHSEGPHLHFEIRNIRSGQVYNPLMFNFPIVDEWYPIIQGIRLIDKWSGADTIVYTKFNPSTSTRIDTIDMSADSVAFELMAYDQSNGSGSKNGIYGVKILSNDSLLFQARMDSFPLSEAKVINACIDYSSWLNGKGMWLRCYEDYDVDLGVSLGNAMYKGWVSFGTQEDSIKNITFDVFDYFGNKSQMKFVLRKNNNGIKKSKDNSHLPFEYYSLLAREENVIKKDNLFIYFPSNSIYSNISFELDEYNDQSSGNYSEVVRIHDAHTPINRPIFVGIQPNKKLSTDLKSKAFIAGCDASGNTVNFGGYWNDQFLISERISFFGMYWIAVDTIAPHISAVILPKKVQVANKWVFDIDDDITLSKSGNNLKYDFFINESWVPATYDLKRKRVTISATSPINQDGTIGIDYCLKVTDPLGNTAEYNKKLN
ncbi:MAG: M23 family metallopeptidase [Saprospiraceae bacterium]|nr:M23 family metallopeptidase [Saprospiraceae bacterium]